MYPFLYRHRHRHRRQRKSKYTSKKGQRKVTIDLLSYSVVVALLRPARWGPSTRPQIWPFLSACGGFACALQRPVRGCFRAWEGEGGKGEVSFLNHRLWKGGRGGMWLRWEIRGWIGDGEAMAGWGVNLVFRMDSEE